MLFGGVQAALDAWWVTVATTAYGEVVMGRRMAAGLTLGFVGITALAACGDDRTTSESSGPPAVAIDDGAESTPPTTLAGVLPTTRAPDATTASGDTVAAGPDAPGRWMNGPFAGPSDYVGPPLEEVLSRTTDTGIVIHAYAWPDGGRHWPVAGTPGWVPAPWCNPSGSLRISMRLDHAVSIGHGSTYTEPFGGISVQPQVAGYAEGTPFTVLVVQAAPDVDSVAATFADGTVDSVAMTNGLALLAAPTAPAHEEMVWTDVPPAGPAYTLTLHRGADVVEVASADVPFPTEDDYRSGCEPPTELPEPGAQPADPAAAEQAVRETFAAVFDITGRAEGDRTWLQHLDSDEGVEDAIEVVLGGSFGSAAQSADYTMGDLVFTSPTEAWFTYDLFANSNDFSGRFGYAVDIDGTWKLSRGVICQDLALAGGYCEPPIGQLYPPAD
jgi:hypothetical protein